MVDTIIAIPSWGRAGNVGKTKFCTANWISSEHWRNTVYYIEPEQSKDYRLAVGRLGARLRDASLAEVPKKWGSIMDLIIDECCEECEHLVIMDDDLSLAYRPQLPEQPTYYEPLTPTLFNQMITDLRAVTTVAIPLTSIQYRQFSQGKSSEAQANQRISMVWSMNCEFFRCNPEFRFYRQSKLDFMTDYYFFLKLLRQGVPNLCLNAYTKDDKPNATGGEKDKRTMKVFNNSVRQFATLFPGYVRVTEKVNKGNWQDGMMGVTIAAARAYKDAIGGNCG